MRRAAKVDNNHAEIRDGLRQLGFSVADTSRLGAGFPDLVCAGLRWSNSQVECSIVETLLIEVKQPKKKLTPDEQEFFNNWQGAIMVATCIEDVLVWFGRV